MIKRVHLVNWKSHKDSTFEFEKGTNVLVGIIGSGKSSLLEAICFALFGTFPALNTRRISLDEVVMNKPSEMDSGKVELAFSYGGKEFLVEREIHKGKQANEAKLKEEGRLIAGPKPRDVTQRIEEILEVDYELFSRAVYSEQNHLDFFLRLSPAQRKEKFDQLLDLERYERARSNSVSLNNRIKKMFSDKNKWLDEMKKEFSKEELEKTREKIREKEKQRNELKERMEKERKLLEEKRSELKAMERKEEEFRSLKERVQQARGKIELTEKGLKETEEEFGVRVAEIQKEEVEGKLSDAREKKKGIEGEQNRLIVLENSLKEGEEKIRLIENQITTCREKIPEGIRSLEELKEKTAEARERIAERSKKVQEMEKTLKENSAEKTKNRTLLAELRRGLGELKKAEAKCPVCETPLSEEKKSGISAHKEREERELNERISQLEKTGEEIEAEKKEAEKELEELKEKEMVLRNAERPMEELRKSEKELEKALEEKKGKENSVLELKKRLEGIDLKGLEKEIEGAEKLLEAKEKGRSLKEMRQEMEKAETRLNEMGFSEKEFRELREETAKRHSGIAAMEKEGEGLKEFISSLEESLKKMNSVRETISRTEKEVASLKELSEKMNYFTNALAAAQSELRETLIETINQAMQDIWPRLYPYNDLVSAKMEIEEGSYELKARERSGRWTRVEGILSGGERSAAAICIRIAFSLVLTRNLGWLILDEPTHNLDGSAVVKLSRMMKEHLPELVDQIFIITHDQEMEKAASASLYLLERNKEEEGVTIPKMLPVV